VSSTDTKYVWEGAEIIESRTADGSTSLQRYYSQGFMDSDGTALYYTRDHLGSVRELMDAQQVVRARYDYDPYGRMTKISGDKDSPFLYAGYFWHSYSGLYLTLYREYDANLGRWISRDPLDEDGGMNLYAYVSNRPIIATDRLGLADWLDNPFTSALVNFGDGITFGLTKWARDQNIYGLEFAKVNECGWLNKGAHLAGNILSLAIGGYYLATAMASPFVPHVFWQGGRAAATEAAAVAAETGGTTLGDTLLGRLVAPLANTLPYNMGGHALWNAASYIYASAASGSTAIAVVSAAGFNAGSILWTTEIPVLESRGIQIILRAIP